MRKLSPGWYWVFCKSELENGWTPEFFNEKNWVGFSSQETPDVIGNKITKGKPTKINACNRCGEQKTLEIEKVSLSSYRARCGYCNNRGKIVRSLASACVNSFLLAPRTQVNA